MSVRFLKALVSAAALVTPFLLVGIAGTDPALAAVSPVTPLSVLPSQVVSGTSAATTADASIVRMAQIYKFLTAPTTVAALKAQSAGTATAAQTAEIASAASASRIPLALGGLAKGAGAVGVAYTGYKIGTGIGATQAGKITTALYGVDANELVCEQAGAGSVGQGLLSFFSGQQCADFNATKDQPLNTDVKSGAAKGKICDSAGWCIEMTGVTYNRQVSSGGSVWAGGDGNYKIPVRCAIEDPRFDLEHLTLILASGATQPANAQPGQGRWGNAEFEDQNDSCTPSTATKFEKAWGWPNQANGPDEIVAFKMGDQTAPITAAPADPDRFISCNITDSNGGQAIAQGGTFKETDSDWNAAIPECPTLDAGLLPVKTELILHTVGGADQTLWSHDLGQDQRDALEKNKDCLTTVCQLILEKDGKSCFDSTDLCTGWYADPHKEDTYTCRYNGAQVELTECNVYRPSWEPDQVAQGVKYADPVTAEPRPASPNTQEQEAVSPSAGTGVANQPADQGKNCFPSGWGVLNPLEWVQKPVQCAFTWAFVPKTSAITTAQNTVATNVANSGIGSLTTALAGFGVIGIGDGGCSGIPIDFKMYTLEVDSHLLAACHGDPLEAVAASTHTILTAVITSAAILASLRYVAVIFGYSGFGGIQSEFRMSDKRAEDRGEVPPSWKWRS